MAKAKQKAREPALRDFIDASIFDQPLARRMVQQRPAWLTDVNGIGETALADVVIEDYLEAARFLLDLGADVNTQDEMLETALFKAARRGYAEVCEALLEAGAEPDIQNDRDEAPLDVVLPRRREQVLGVFRRYDHQNLVPPLIQRREGSREC